MSNADQKPIGSGFGAKTNVREIIDGVDLSGKLAVITGGYSGIGLETTRAIAGAGAKCIVPARSRQKAEEALKGVAGDIVIADMDLGDIASVRKFADDVSNAHSSLHLLINNAGIMACPETRVGPGWEAQFGTNHLGHFALAAGLAPLLQNAGAKNGGARVVALSSTANRMSDILWDDIHFEKTDYDKWAAYGQSKTANSLFAVALDARMRTDGVRAFAVHPGGINTPLQRHLPNEEMVALGWKDESGEMSEMAKSFFKTPEEGAATTVWCATSERLNGRGGVYCEDCDVAQIATKDSPRYFHVEPYAVDGEAAARLWGVSEKMLAAA